MDAAFMTSLQCLIKHWFYRKEAKLPNWIIHAVDSNIPTYGRHKEWPKAKGIRDSGGNEESNNFLRLAIHNFETPFRLGAFSASHLHGLFLSFLRPLFLFWLSSFFFNKIFLQTTPFPKFIPFGDVVIWHFGAFASLDPFQQKASVQTNIDAWMTWCFQ